MKILLFKIGALGDILMTTPVIRQLRRMYPDAKIDYMCGKSFVSVLGGNKNLNEVIPIDENIFLKKNLFGILSISNMIKKKNYDVILVFDKHWIFSFLAKLSGVKRRIGFSRLGKEGMFYTDKVVYGPVKHEVHYYLELLSKLIGEKNLNYKDIKLDFFLDKKTIDSMKSLLKLKKISNFVICANFGGDNAGEKGSIRKMPDDLFKNILDKLSKNNKIILLGGKNDFDYCAKFSDGKRIFNLAGLSIRESIVIMKFAKRIYTTDCGTMHMAATANENITCFFGPTNPKRKAPLVKGLKVFWSDQDIYDEDYELFGKIPKEKNFFIKVKFDDIRIVS
ncbi:MAG: glycosyltransferase family 9 protein [Candidatus Woesearchaeota archaeon]